MGSGVKPPHYLPVSNALTCAQVLLDAHLLWAPEHHDPEHDSGSDVSRN
jgi:hypothetical protein